MSDSTGSSPREHGRPQDEGEYTDDDVQAASRPEPPVGEYTDRDDTPGVGAREHVEDEGSFTDTDVRGGDRHPATEGEYTDIDED